MEVFYWNVLGKCVKGHISLRMITLHRQGMKAPWIKCENDVTRRIWPSRSPNLNLTKCLLEILKWHVFFFLFLEVNKNGEIKLVYLLKICKVQNSFLSWSFYCVWKIKMIADAGDFPKMLICTSPDRKLHHINSYIVQVHVNSAIWPKSVDTWSSLSSYYRFSFSFVVIITVALLPRLFTWFWSVAMGIIIQPQEH